MVIGAQLIGAGPGPAAMLTEQARGGLKKAALVLADAELEPLAVLQEGWDGTLAWVQADEASQQAARDRMLSALGQGQSVARLRRGEGWQSASALRDIRALSDAGFAVEVLPGVSEQSAAWRSWLGEHPLYARRIVLTRMREQAEQTAELLRQKGAEPWIFPTLELAPPPEPARLEQALLDLATYEFVVFTSANGVEQVFETLHRLQRDTRAFGPVRVAAIGTATAGALRQRGLVPDLVAKEFRGEQLAEDIVSAWGEGLHRRVLLPRALEAREVLPEQLSAHGFVVDVVPAYQMRLPAQAVAEELREALRQGLVDAVFVTSSSTVRNLCKLLGEQATALLSRTCLASIGPITTQSAEDLGLKVTVPASPYTLEGLIQAVERHFAPAKG